MYTKAVLTMREWRPYLGLINPVLTVEHVTYPLRARW